ncbi:MAG: LysR family transcriptional regulator [Hyphomicrobium sp.]|nr:MAG: LysR family transcriptional regulator [Hyphomicrobium sp.]
MAHVTLKQLRYFDALARSLHFGRAADECSVTQPALSMQIQELELSLGAALVERTRTGVRLTDLGRDFADRSRRILADIRDLTEFAVHSGARFAGTLRLGVIPSVAPYMLPPLMPLLQTTYPDLKLHIRETQTATLVQELIDGKLDVLLLALPIQGNEIEVLELFDDRFLLALPTSHAISVNVRATPELIEHERLLLLEEGHCLRDQALTYCELKQIEGVDTFGASSLATIVEMVAAGYGVTLLPEMSLGVETRNRAIGIMRFASPEPSRKIGLAWRHSSPRRADFIELGPLIKTAAVTALQRDEVDAPKKKKTTSTSAAS